MFAAVMFAVLLCLLLAVMFVAVMFAAGMFATYYCCSCRALCLFVYFFTGKNKSEDCCSATNTLCSSPFAELKLVPVKDRWVVKGRLKFTRTYPSTSKHFNLRYPYARKVFVYMCYVKRIGLRGCVVITCSLYVRNRDSQLRKKRHLTPTNGYKKSYTQSQGRKQVILTRSPTLI